MADRYSYAAYRFAFAVINVTSRVMESAQLEMSFKDDLVQLPCNRQGHIQLDQIAQGLKSL